MNKPPLLKSGTPKIKNVGSVDFSLKEQNAVFNFPNIALIHRGERGEDVLMKPVPFHTGILLENMPESARLKIEITKELFGAGYYPLESQYISSSSIGEEIIIYLVKFDDSKMDLDLPFDIHLIPEVVVSMTANNVTRGQSQR